MLIQILGTGCAKCNELEKLVKTVVAEAGIAATVEKVTDIKQIASMGVFATPALVIDGVVKAVGGIPAKKDILSWID
jgi:small redox-active disulfide protein 2